MVRNFHSGDTVRRPRLAALGNPTPHSASARCGAILRHISGTYRQTGSRADRSTNPACKTPVAYSTRCSPPPKASNRGGTISVSAPRKGVVQLTKLDAGASETTMFPGGDTGRATVDVAWAVSFEPVGG
jgi:hypothetical protein